MKIADNYLEVDPWSVVERGFHPERSRVSESLFSIANEHTGTRGYFDEGYSGDSLVGTYVNGLYEQRVEEAPGSRYRGVSNRVCYTVNTVDWLSTRIRLDGELLDLHTASFREFTRRIDLKSGLMTRCFVWTTATGKAVELEFERLLDMVSPVMAHQRITVTPLNFSGLMTIDSGLDFSFPHELYKANCWESPWKGETSGTSFILGRTVGTGQELLAGYRLSCIPETRQTSERCEAAQYLGHTLQIDLRLGERTVIEKQVSLERLSADVTAAAAARAGAQCKSFDAVLAGNTQYWHEVWSRSDITIEGDEENQQGIRYCIFQLEQTFSGKVGGANIGAKGLTGEVYNGNAFWDTEVFCLPYYLFGNPPAARSLLEFRLRTLPQAIMRARDLDCEGACFPVATIDGTESCTLWQHASLQFQPTTAVAYAIHHYELATGDTEFVQSAGLELLIQICRFLVSRCGWSQRKGMYGFYSVMGPDEFQMMVNHNAYTNYMAKRSLEYTLTTIERFRADKRGHIGELLDRFDLDGDELARWAEVARNMYIPRDGGSGVFEQHEGFFDLPHVDVDSIPVEEFPLYHSWSYDRIYRNDMIKQPDVLMFMFLHSQSFSLEEKRANYEYYEPRCIHESSLSPSVHSILAAELGRDREALDFFRFATRIDLDNYNRNTAEGLHITAIAGAWMNIVYGFGGFRSDGEVPVLSPTLPTGWRSYTFRLTLGGSRIAVKVDTKGATLTLLDGPTVEMLVDGEAVRVDTGGVHHALRWREENP
jgi:maltose phosphorylase